MGRPKGSPNKAHANARAAIARFVDSNADRMQAWLDRIAEDDPKGAFDRFTAVIEYHIPKLARTEHSGPDGEAIPLEMKLTFVEARDAGDS